MDGVSYGRGCLILMGCLLVSSGDLGSNLVWTFLFWVVLGSEEGYFFCFRVFYFVGLGWLGLGCAFFPYVC